MALLLAFALLAACSGQLAAGSGSTTTAASTTGEPRLGGGPARDAGAGSTSTTTTTEPPPPPEPEKVIALTFDDGPAPETERLLDVLADLEVTATFFVVGSQVRAFPEITARAAAEGHEIQNHTWSHPDLTRLSDAQVADQLIRTSDIVELVTGTRPTMARPPMGRIDARVEAQIEALVGPAVLWTGDTWDWRWRVTDQVFLRAVAAATPNGILLFHDIHPTTVDAVTAVVEHLRSEGYRFVSASEALFRQRSAPPEDPAPADGDVPSDGDDPPVEVAADAGDPQPIEDAEVPSEG